MQGLMTIFWKELADHFNGWRAVMLSLLIYGAGLSSLWIANQNIREEVTETTSFVFLRLFAVSQGGLGSFLFFMAILLPIVGIILGFDAMNSEKSSGNLSRLLSQPIYRDSVINAKFLAGIFTLSILMTSIVTIVAGMGLRMIGVPPGPEEILRLIFFLFFSIVYGAFWLALAILFSLLFGQVTTSALTTLALWVFAVIFSLFGIAGFIANAIVPVDQSSSIDLIAKNLGVTATLNRISPVFLYEEASILLILPKTLTGFGLSGELMFPLPFEQSLLLIWPHLTSLIALSALCFAISYIKFMREEIRST